MSAVVKAVSSVVKGVGEAVGSIVEGAVDIVKDVGKAIDKYVIQPVLDDPLTAIATAAGAYYLGPIIGSQLSLATGSAVATGAGAAAGNLAGNLVQGEDFDKALKEAAITGVTVGATKAATNYFMGDAAAASPGTPSAGNYGIGEVGVDIDAFGRPIDALAGTNPYVSDFGSAATSGPVISPVSYVPPVEQAIAPQMGDLSSGISYYGDTSLDAGALASQSPTIAAPSYLPAETLYEMSLGDFAPGETLPGNALRPIPDAMGNLAEGISYQGDTSLGPQTFLEPPSYLPADSLYEMSLGDFGPGETLPPSAIYEGQYFDPYTDPRSYVSGRDVTTNMFEGDLTPDPYAYRGDPSTLTAGEVGAPPGTDMFYIENQLNPDYSLTAGRQPQQTMMGAQTPGFRMPTLSDLASPDYYKDMGSAAWNFAKENPMTTLLGGTMLLGAASGPPQMPPPPTRRPGESDERFRQRLQLYEYQRSQLPVDISNYGYGPQGKFFTPATYRPIEPVAPVEGAAQGGLMSVNPEYYTYGAPMANGGRMIKSPLALGGVADGRSDDVPAVLSDGEYVIDAETVALLGNGSVDAGAAQLDRMREEIRRHKGQSLAKGKISPDARGALSYIKE